MKTVRQRDIFWADLDPIQGSEQAGKRPVVVISGDTLNEHLPVCIVCPLSSELKNYATCTLIPRNKTNGLKADSELITFQVRTISRQRLARKVGCISKAQMNETLAKLSRLFTY